MVALVGVGINGSEGKTMVLQATGCCCASCTCEVCCCGVACGCNACCNDTGKAVTASPAGPNSCCGIESRSVEKAASATASRPSCCLDAASQTASRQEKIVR